MVGQLIYGYIASRVRVGKRLFPRPRRTSLFIQKHRVAGLLLGAATAMKLYPALLLAAFGPREKAQRILPWVVAPVGALYLVHGVWAGGPDVLGFLPQYVGVAEDHNIGLRRLFEALLPDGRHTRTVAFGLCVATLGVGAAWIFRRDEPLERKALLLAGLYLAVLPTAFHPWYALWLIPWLCFYPSAGWLWLTAMLPLSYLKYGSPGGVMPAWVVPLEWIPTAALLAIEAFRHRRLRPL